MSERDLDRLDQIADHLSDIRAELSAIKVDLRHHIYRTDLLENKFESAEKDITKLHGFFTIGGWLVGIVATIITILNMFKII